MSADHQLGPTDWIAYWHTLSLKECAKHMAYFRKRSAQESEAMESCVARLSSADQAVIRTALEAAEHKALLLLHGELIDAFALALKHADNGVQPGEKPRIIK